jgi:hypothetical protein
MRVLGGQQQLVNGDAVGVAVEGGWCGQVAHWSQSPLGGGRTDETRNKKAPLLSEAGLFEDLAIRRLRLGYLARRCPVRTGTVLIWFHIMVATHDIATTAAKPVVKTMFRASCETIWIQ